MVCSIYLAEAADFPLYSMSVLNSPLFQIQTENRNWHLLFMLSDLKLSSMLR